VTKSNFQGIGAVAAAEEPVAKPAIVPTAVAPVIYANHAIQPLPFAVENIMYAIMRAQRANRRRMRPR